MKPNSLLRISLFLVVFAISSTRCQATCYYLINIECADVFPEGNTCHDTYCVRAGLIAWNYYCPLGTLGYEPNDNSYWRAEVGTYDSVGSKGNLVLDAPSAVTCVDVFECRYHVPCTVQSWIFGNYHCDTFSDSRTDGGGAHGDDVFGHCDPCEDDPYLPECGYDYGQGG